MGGDSDDAEWQMLFGAKVKTPVDMPDDILKDIITVSTQTLSECESLEANGHVYIQKIKEHMDEKWEPNWHIIVGRNFGNPKDPAENNEILRPADIRIIRKEFAE